MDDFYTEKLSSAKPRVAHTGGKKTPKPGRRPATQKNFPQRSREWDIMEEKPPNPAEGQLHRKLFIAEKLYSAKPRIGHTGGENL